MKRIALLTSIAIAAISGGPTVAASSANAHSALGMNLNAMSYYSPEQPFLNVFKTTGITQATNGWSTRSSSMAETNEESYLQLDASGYPTSLKAGVGDSSQQFTQACTLILSGLSPSNAGTGLPYQSGQYVVEYDGQGTLAYRNDASVVSTSAGRDVFNVAKPTAGGVWICIVGTDPQGTGNYLRNIRVVKAENEGLLDAGQMFSPTFIGLMKNFRVLRAMQWLGIDNTPTPPGTWTQRPQETDAGWGSNRGVPLEVVVQLCNTVGADCWLNVPHTADDNYITQMATLVHSTLGTKQNVYIEFSNEVWNSTYPQYSYAVSAGMAAWPSAGATAGQYNRSWYGMRTAQMCDIWKSVWGNDFPRVVCVLGAQAASPATATASLDCSLWVGTGNAPCSGHNIGAVAIAPYFGFYSPPTSWLSDSDGGLTAFFSQLNLGGLVSGDYPGGDLAQASSWESAYKSALAPYKLPFIAYEGGQTFEGFPSYQNGSAVVNLMIAANRDPRMGVAYTQALTDWKNNGGELYVLYNDIYSPSQYGEWGALESYLDTVIPLTSAPPKWQAIQNFISGNPCWWSNCAGTVGLGPAAPSGFHVVN